MCRPDRVPKVHWQLRVTMSTVAMYYKGVVVVKSSVHMPAAQLVTALLDDEIAYLLECCVPVSGVRGLHFGVKRYAALEQYVD